MLRRASELEDEKGRCKGSNLVYEKAIDEQFNQVLHWFMEAEWGDFPPLPEEWDSSMPDYGAMNGGVIPNLDRWDLQLMIVKWVKRHHAIWASKELLLDKEQRTMKPTDSDRQWLVEDESEESESERIRVFKRKKTTK
jgi:hypothetical protein